MSTEFAIDCDPPIMYDEFISDPPTGIRVMWRSDSGTPLGERRARVYVEGVDHAELRDACDNVMVVSRAGPHAIKHNIGTVLGEAVFEQWGLGGWSEHFNAAILARYGGELYDVVTTLPASDLYHGRCKRCRQITNSK